ncbi:MAG: phosphate ABC transporter permease subunit PstC [Proteobacteria bacterium]|nr:phosphate ABC transporter permease subunit PstC [Pseudomonadota bacterium]
MLALALFLIAGLTILAYVGSRRRAIGAGRRNLHSLPYYHGFYVALWVGIPSLVVVVAWLALQGTVIDSLLLASLTLEATAGKDAGQIDLLLGEIKNVAAGLIFQEPSASVQAAAERYAAWEAIAHGSMVAVAVAICLIAGILAARRLSPQFRARQSVEQIVGWLMLLSSIIAVMTTAGIVLSLVFESLRFFARVPVWDFLFGLAWEPQIALREDQIAGAGAFGAIPVFTGTLLIAFIAMLIAGPIGLLAAIYNAEYAHPRFRAVAKPMLEILAGVPTVVYGFFAVLTVAPALREFGAALGLSVAPNSAMAAGAVMGIMIIPFISSLSDDALSAVPQSMRDGSYALGSTQAETIRQVLLPAALPGIVGGFLLAISRAIGETMIVVMAAGLIASLTANPFSGVTTVTVQIVTLLIGDTEFDSPKTLAAFALGLVLFVVTLGLNVLALRIVQKYREKYE